MAEAIFNTKNIIKGHRAMSAGIHPADRIQPDTLAVLQEAGINTADLMPKLVDDELMRRADRIIAMDDWVAEQLKSPTDEVWDIPDPYRSTIDSYRNTRDILLAQVQRLIDKIGEQ
jgi:protein-tyrosine-phosphatase